MKKRIFAILLSFIAVVSLFSACKPDRTEPDAADNPAIELNDTEEKPDEENKSSGETAEDPASSDEDENADEKVPEETVLSPEEEAALYYTGNWSFYVPSLLTEAAHLIVGEDGTYTAQVISADAFTDTDGDAAPCAYRGTWSLVPAEGYLIPYGIRLSLEYTDDALMEGWRSIGDFVFDKLTLCDGQLLADLIQLNNGDSFISMHLDRELSGVLTKDTDLEVTETRRAGQSFYAQMPKNRYGYRSEPGDFGYGEFVIFVDEVTLGGDGYEIINDVRESVPYIVGEGEGTSELSGGNDGLMPYGNGVYRITTDSEGKIIDARFIPTDPPPTEDEAIAVFENCAEVIELMQSGTKWMSEGIDVIDSQNSLIFVFGSDRYGQFVREERYAVSSSLDVYHYDPVMDQWNCLETAE